MSFNFSIEKQKIIFYTSYLKWWFMVMMFSAPHRSLIKLFIITFFKTILWVLSISIIFFIFLIVLFMVVGVLFLFRMFIFLFKLSVLHNRIGGICLIWWAWWDIGICGVCGILSITYLVLWLIIKQFIIINHRLIKLGFI